MDLAPPLPSQAGDGASDVPGRHHERSARLQPAGGLLDRAHGPGEMLDGVPEADHVEGLGPLGRVQEVPEKDGQTKLLPGVGNALRRDVHPGDVPVLPGQLQEETVCRADLEQTARGRDLAQPEDPAPEILLQDLLIRPVIAVFAPGEVLLSVELTLVEPARVEHERAAGTLHDPSSGEAGDHRSGASAELARQGPAPSGRSGGPGKPSRRATR